MTTGTESKLFKAVSQCELSLYSLIFVSLIHFIPFFSSILMLKYLFFSATPCFGFPSSTHNFLPCLLSPNFFFSVSETSYPPSICIKQKCGEYWWNFLIFIEDMTLYFSLECSTKYHHVATGEIYARQPLNHLHWLQKLCCDHDRN